MTYTIIITYFRKNGVKDTYTYENLDKTMRDVRLDHTKEYAQAHTGRYTGYCVKTMSYNAKGKLVKTVTACKTFIKYTAWARMDTHGEAMRFYGNSLEQLVRNVRNAITGKGAHAHGYIRETEAYREQTGTGTAADIIVNNISQAQRDTKGYSSACTSGLYAPL